MLFLSQVVSTNYREAFKGCFELTVQVVAKAKADWDAYPDNEERFLSFLFNLLENSLNIRSNSENLILYGEALDWVNYAKYFGSLVRDLIYFKFEVGSPLGDLTDEIVYA